MSAAMPDWSEQSWSRIALETAHRAAVYGRLLGDGDGHYLQKEAEPLSGLYGVQTLNALGPQPTEAAEWYWVYAPILLKLLNGPAVLVGLGNHLFTSNGLRRHWLNFVPAGFNAQNLTNSESLEAKALALIGCNAKDPVSWSETVALTTELAEEDRDGGNLLGPLVVTINGCGDLDGMDERSLLTTSMPEPDGAVPSVVLGGEPTLPLRFLPETWIRHELNGYSGRLASRAKPVTHKFGDDRNSRVGALCVWLSDILRARDSEEGGTIVTVPAWLTPTEPGMPSGSITVYLKKKEWFEKDAENANDRFEALAAFASAYHSGSMAYIARFEREQQARLRRVDEVFSLLQKPLREVTKAVQTLQTSSQELQAVLDEPSATLFGSYRRIAPCFDPTDQTDMNYGQCQSRILHEPKDYGATGDCSQCKEPIAKHAQWIAAIAMCRVVGRDDELRKSRSGAELAARAREILREIDNIPQFSQLRVAIQDVAADFDGTSPSLLDVIAESAKAIRFLETLKACVFTPFKVGEKSWPTTALKLLTARAGQQRTNPEWDIKSGSLIDSATYAPLAYNALLQFLHKATQQFARTEKQTPRFVKKLQAIKAGKSTVLDVTFGGDKYCDAQWLASLRTKVKAALAVPREWRVEHANVGDFSGPFVELTTHLLNVGDDENTSWVASDKTDADGWHTVLNLCRRNPSRRFTIAVGVGDLAANSGKGIRIELAEPEGGCNASSSQRS